MARFPPVGLVVFFETLVGFAVADRAMGRMLSKKATFVNAERL
jgi:hypothetical protein